MKHYPHHIGDFNQATRHLTRIERSIYRDLLDLYYDTEKQLPLDDVWIRRKVIAHSNEEVTAVEQVLNEFFTKTPTGWYHERCEAEIEAYRSNTSQKALAGKASAEAKRIKKLQALNGFTTYVQQPLNSVATADNGASTNHQPSTNQPIKEANASLRGKKKCPVDFVVTPELAAWAASDAPLVDLALETDKLRDYTFSRAITDWAGAWRNWMRKAQKDAESRPRSAPKQNFESFAERDERRARERIAEATGTTIKPTDMGMVIDITPQRISA